MLKDNHEHAEQVANRLVEDYADHGFCINIDEAKSLGLVIDQLSDEQLQIIWLIHKLARRKSELQIAERRKEIAEQLKGLPPGLLDSLPHGILNQEGTSRFRCRRSYRWLITFAVSVRLAGMLLLKNAQITLEEIEALPFVQGREEAYAIAQRLLKEFQPPYRIEIDSGFDGSECRLRLSSGF